MLPLIIEWRARFLRIATASCMGPSAGVRKTARWQSRKGTGLYQAKAAGS